jgi:DNA mismatch repair ATPase MutS
LLQKESVQFISIWLNVAFLAELVAYTLALKHFAQLRSVLQSTYQLLGSIDASIAVASCLERFPDHCRPQFASTRLIDIEASYHPLLAIPVHNSLCLDGRSALIAGSNMAGKTTMIKTIGTNIIFGRTLGFCLATRATIPQSSVMASIRSEHSVESGKSHYFAEIERLQAFIECAGRGDCRVFIIDELFSGTNTVERIAIARAVLERLCADAQVLVTTHDVELQQYLSDEYDLYHFQENPDIEGFFDYQMRPGAATERNAIRLLDRVGFPSEVVARAMKLT